MNYYDENVYSYIPKDILFNPFFDEWYLIVEEILKSDEFQKRKLFMHHHNLSVWDHSILVSFKSFITAKYLNADSRVCAIAGLLHDFYTQAWISTPEIELLDDGIHAINLHKKLPLFKMHGFTHGADAAINYVKYFSNLENKKVTNSIKNHMFPLTIIPPRYIEGYIISWIDKVNSCSELPSFKSMLKIAFDRTIGYLYRSLVNLFVK